MKAELASGLRQPAQREVLGSSRWALAARLDAIAAFLEAHPWAIFAIICRSLSRLCGDPRQGDVFSGTMNCLPTILRKRRPSDRMLKEASSIDLNPPLYYIAARFVHSAFPPQRLFRAAAFDDRVSSGRLPPVFLCAQAAHSDLWALWALWFCWGACTRATPSRRALMRWFSAFLGVAAVGWQRAIEENKSAALARRCFCWLLGGFGMLLSHVLALIAYGAFFFAELVRFRHPAKAGLAALGLPGSAADRPSCSTCRCSAAMAPEHFRSSFKLPSLRLSESYSGGLDGAWPRCLAVAMIAIVLLGRAKRVSTRTRPGRPELAFLARSGAFAGLPALCAADRRHRVSCGRTAHISIAMACRLSSAQAFWCLGSSPAGPG